MNNLESMSTEQIESGENLNEMNPSSDPIHHEVNEEGTVGHDTAAEEEKGTIRQSAHKEHFEKFLKELEKQPDNESKLQFTIEFMEASIGQSGSPHFKSFWEARNICLQLFKENISPVVRGIIWNKYNELSKEARRLKEILDEQSAFAVEQIEIAVTALESDIASFAEQIDKSSASELETVSRALGHRLPYYRQQQRELNLLNTQASRINALRKELIRTEMRVRQKNKFFQRLSVAGDKVFPRRKELIKQVSDSFIADVDSFIADNFREGHGHENLFALREEIKSLQGMAKALTLNTHSFTHTRMRLSECWDKIKGEEKERKKERALQKSASKELLEKAMEELKAFSEKQPELSTAEATKQLDEMGNRFRKLDLGRDEKQELREAYNEAKRPVQEKVHAEEAARHKHEQDRDAQRRQKILEIRQEIEALLADNASMDSEQLETRRSELLEKINSSQASKGEKLEMERQLKPLKDIIIEKRESALLTLSADDRQSLQQLKEVLKQRKDRRQECKEQLDAFRKSSGNSGLDFEQAMNYNLQVAAEKERLEKINQGIEEIEQKIAQLSKKK